MMPFQGSRKCRPAVEMGACVLLLLFLLRCPLAAAETSDGTEPMGESRSSAAAPGKVRLSAQRAAEINNCLRYAPDVGCDTFACLQNTNCALGDLHDICRDFLWNAGYFDIQGKQFIKDFLKCSARGIKSRFSCSVTRCAAIQGILSKMQANCYQAHNICAAANNNVDAFVNMVDHNKMFLNRAHLEYIRVLFDCGTTIIDAIRSSLRSQLGSTAGILRQLLLDDSCGILEREAQATISEGNVDANTTRNDNWDEEMEEPVHGLV